MDAAFASRSKTASSASLELAPPAAVVDAVWSMASTAARVRTFRGELSLRRRLPCAIAIALSALALLTTAALASPSSPITTFGIPSAHSLPEGIAAGADGDLWFTETGNGRIGRITPAGVITEFTIPTPGSRPNGITAGPEGNLWFTETVGDRISRITPAGAITEFDLPSPLSAPTAITAGPEGDLWFELYAQRIGRIAPTATPVPEIMALRQSAATWRERKRLAQISATRRRPPVGSVFTFSLSTPATVSFTFTRKLSGRIAAGGCVAQRPQNASHRRCVRAVTARRLSFAGHSATNRVIFEGRITPAKKLKPDRCTPTVNATDSAGAAEPQRLSFTIVDGGAFARRRFDRSHLFVIEKVSPASSAHVQHTDLRVRPLGECPLDLLSRNRVRS
jgi:hypothetical protein